ncbi:hypothetical protein I309_03509 [Cryptococcus deuterogattii LA55]|nr:hypothetical protein I309_03509 [Cryptococcus deuterogattii LA55]KIR91582.1 hypothetical protein I304_04404 [Cryptococcus deuterogattii CBS 10090]
MPPDNRTSSSSSAQTGSKKRSTTPKRNAIACLRCKERKARCVPAPPGSSPVPTCTNCLGAKKDCVYLDRTPNEIFLLEYVSQLESRCAALELELRKINPRSQFSADHIHMPAEAREAAVDKLNAVYPRGPLRIGANGLTSGDQAATLNVDTGPGPSPIVATPSMKTDDRSASRASDIGSRNGALNNESENNDGGDEDDFALGIGMLSLGGGEEPVYVGPSSGVNWARVCATALRRPRDRSQPSHLSRFSYLAPPELASVQSALEYTLHHPTPPLPPPALAAHYLDLVYDHVQSRYGCFDWQTVYYNAAVACLSTLTSHHSLATVQALVFLTIYGFRHPTAEVMMSAQLGRPSGIQDRDIDVELPLNVDVDFNQPKALAAMQSQQLDMMDGKRPGDEYANGYGPVTSMTSAIHNIRLNQLKHRIQDAIYRLDKPLFPTKDVLTAERHSIPEVDNLLVPMLSREHWELEYHNCVQMLLRPIVASRRAGREYVSHCLKSAAALCESQYANLQPPIDPSKLSAWRFYRIFLAGMTLLHVVTTLPADLSEHDRRRAENAIRQCEVSLGVWGEGFRGAKRHEKLFKELVTAWEARRKDESKVNAPKALPPITSGCSQQSKPLEPPAPHHPTPQSEPRADVLSQFLHIVNLSQSTPTRPELLGGQEPATPMQALYAADVTCSGGAGVRDGECLAESKKVMGFNGAEAAGGANTGLNSVFGTMAPPPSAMNNPSARNMPSQHPGPEGWRQSVAAVGDVHTGQWTTDVYLDNDVGSSHAAGGGLGIKDDFFSLISSFGVDTNMQAPLFAFDGSEPTFDYYPSHQASTTYIQDPQSQNPYAVGNNSTFEWNTGTEGMDMLGGSGLGGMNILSLGMNLGGGMDSAMSHDANMGMSDWALFDNNDNRSEPKFQQ